MLNNKAAIVLGVHRSGTSALAGTLSMLGIQFGKSLRPANAKNPRGLWEHNEILNLHDRIRAGIGILSNDT